jgi:hypothetical protein
MVFGADPYGPIAHPGALMTAAALDVPRHSSSKCDMKASVSNQHVNLAKDEQSLIDETAPHALESLDAQALKKLQTRLRNAREKNFSLLRRQGAARVEEEGGRGAAAPANERRRDKVDVFDEALERVSARLDEVDE